ncbi:MAG: CpsB/CapC family capsule biosynthesis tyrosine phosphatase [Bacteroidota bacterium]
MEKGLEGVREQLQRKKIDIEIVGAAEYLIDDGFKILLKENKIMTFSHKHVLVELSYFGVPPYLYELSFDMQVKGYKIILAHPERYLFWHNDMYKYQELKHRGFLFQLNITSLTGHYSEEVRKMAQKLIDANMIDLIGSDLHNFHYLNLLKKSLYEPYLDKLLQSGNIKNHLL